MANTRLDIYNRALQKIGGDELSNTTGTDIYTTALNRCYYDVLEAELREHNWNFAIRRQNISRHRITVTGITSAPVGVVTYTGTDPENGQRVEFPASSMTEMTEVNGKVYRINNLDKANKTFALADKDTGADIDTSTYTDETTGAAIEVMPVFGWSRKFFLPKHTLTITAVTRANPAVVTFTGENPVDGDLILIQSVGGMTELNGNYYKISKLDLSGTKTFTLQDEDGNEVDASAYTAYTSGGTAKTQGLIRFIRADGFYGLVSNIGNDGWSNDSTVERNQFYCNDDGPINIEFVWNDVDVNNWDPMFKEAVVCRLAREISTEIKQDDSNWQKLESSYQVAIRRAKMADAIESPPIAQIDDDYIIGRN